MENLLMSPIRREEIESEKLLSRHHRASNQQSWNLNHVHDFRTPLVLHYLVYKTHARRQVLF